MAKKSRKKKAVVKAKKGKRAKTNVKTKAMVKRKTKVKTKAKAAAKKRPTRKKPTGIMQRVANVVRTAVEVVEETNALRNKLEPPGTTETA